ncbi:hypothetical protein Pelo_8186 [Pelomyxa schiedti]|nr:hypothetical protein Pelo_8186 [Pelomyxa schiedti]
MEDMCVKSGGGLTNFFQTAFDIGCKPGNTSRACLDAVSQAALVPASCCIGSIHMLSTFMMAQALGMKSEYAYQLAVYSSATDYDQFIACDACGTPLAKSLTPPPMSSMRRVNMTTGGFISHLPLTYDGHYGTGTGSMLIITIIGMTRITTTEMTIMITMAISITRSTTMDACWASRFPG